MSITTVCDHCCRETTAYEKPHLNGQVNGANMAAYECNKCQRIIFRTPPMSTLEKIILGGVIAGTVLSKKK